MFLNKIQLHVPNALKDTKQDMTIKNHYAPKNIRLLIICVVIFKEFKDKYKCINIIIITMIIVIFTSLQNVFIRFLLNFYNSFVSF